VKHLLFVLLSFCALTTARAENALSSELRTTTLERGRVIATAFFTGKLETIWDACNDEGRAQFGNLEALKTYRADQNALGQETRLVKEEVTLEGDDLYYTRSLRLEKAQGEYQLWVGFDDAGKVTKLVLQPAPDAGDAPSGGKG
jgi:hypothetical protein